MDEDVDEDIAIAEKELALAKMKRKQRRLQEKAAKTAAAAEVQGLAAEAARAAQEETKAKTAGCKAAIAKENDDFTTDSSITENETQLRNLNESSNAVNVTPGVNKRKSGDNSRSSSSSGESSKERKTEPKDRSSSSANSNDANSNISGNLPSTTRVQQKKPPQQGESNASGMNPKTEEIKYLQARFDLARLSRDEYAQDVEDLKVRNEELMDSLMKQKEIISESKWEAGRLGGELDWLWNQVQTFAHHDKESNTVLMVIEPEESRSSWETWVLKDGTWVPKRVNLLLTTAPFKICGHANCKFVMRWFTGTSQMEKVVQKQPQNPFTRTQIITAKAMQDVARLKKQMIRLVRTCTTCENEVPDSTQGCDGCKNRVATPE